MRRTLWPARSIGAPKRTWTVRGRITKLVRFWTSSRPSRPTGTIGRPVRSASSRPPRRNGSSRPSSERSSSGKISTETPRPRCASAERKLPRRRSVWPRSTGTKPPSRSAWPKTGIRNRLALARKSVGPGSAASRAGMSKRLSWLATYTQPRAPASSTSDSTSSRSKLAASRHLAQVRATPCTRLPNGGTSAATIAAVANASVPATRKRLPQTVAAIVRTRPGGSVASIRAMPLSAADAPFYSRAGAGRRAAPERRG